MRPAVVYCCAGCAPEDGAAHTTLERRASNSLLVVCIGATLGKTARLEVPGVTNQQINAVIGLDEQDADQLVAILASNSGQQALWTGAGSTTIPQLNKSSFQRINVPWEDDFIRLKRSTELKNIKYALLQSNHELDLLEAFRNSTQSAVFGGSQ